VFVGGGLVGDGCGEKVTVAVGGKTVALGTAVFVMTGYVSDARVAGVSVKGGGMVGFMTVAWVRSTVGNTNGVGDRMGRLQPARTRISAIPSV